MIKINLEYLQAFYVTVKCNSISKASKQLHMTQPGLSLQLKNLEKELGANLLIRSNKGVQLTEEGKVVFDYANTILSIQDNIERDLKNLKQTRPKLIIGSCKSVGEYALPCSIYTYKKVHEEIDIDMKICNSDEVINKLRDHSINIGIIQYKHDYEDISTIKIISDNIVLVKNYESDERKTISLEELKKVPLLIREKNSGTRYHIEHSLASHGISIDELNIMYDLNSLEAIKSSVISSKGYSLLPKLAIQQELKSKRIEIVDVEDLDITFHYYIAHRKNYTLTEFEEKFVQFIKSSRRGFC